MRRLRAALLVVPVVTLAAGCGSAGHTTPTTTHTTTRTTRAPSTSTTGAHGTTTTAPPGLTVQVTASPSVMTVGTPVVFTVTIRGPGVLSGEDVHFGDGGTTGANAGMVPCGQTARADATRTYTHAYLASGTYRFTDAVSVIGPQPTCTSEDVTGSATATVAAPVSSATADGAFLSPTRNLACEIAQNPSSQVRCVSFAPPLLVTMTTDGTLTRCTGSSCELGNPASDTPVLAYGAAVGNPEFLCLSTTVGITCTVPEGRGFTISRSGVTTVGS